MTVATAVKQVRYPYCFRITPPFGKDSKGSRIKIPPQDGLHFTDSINSTGQNTPEKARTACRVHASRPNFTVNTRAPLAANAPASTKRPPLKYPVEARNRPMM
jgi:hypothetical protein